MFIQSIDRKFSVAGILGFITLCHANKILTLNNIGTLMDLKCNGTQIWHDTDQEIKKCLKNHVITSNKDIINANRNNIPLLFYMIMLLF